MLPVMPTAQLAGLGALTSVTALSNSFRIISRSRYHIRKEESPPTDLTHWSKNSLNRFVLISSVSLRPDSAAASTALALCLREAQSRSEWECGMSRGPSPKDQGFMMTYACAFSLGRSSTLSSQIERPGPVTQGRNVLPLTQKTG